MINKQLLELANLIKLYITTDEAWIPLMKNHGSRYLFYIRGWELIFECDDHIRIGDINANYIRLYDNRLEIHCIDSEYQGIIDEAVTDSIKELDMDFEILYI